MQQTSSFNFKNSIFILVKSHSYIAFALVTVDSLPVEWRVKNHRENIYVGLVVASTFVIADIGLVSHLLRRM